MEWKLLWGWEGVFCVCANNSVLTRVLNAGHRGHTLAGQYIYELSSFFRVTLSRQTQEMKPH